MKQFPMPHQREKITLMIVNKLSMLPEKGKWDQFDEKIYKETEKQAVETIKNLSKVN